MGIQKDIEALFLRVVERCDGRKARAAELLGVSVPTFLAWLKGTRGTSSRDSLWRAIDAAGGVLTEGKAPLSSASALGIVSAGAELPQPSADAFLAVPVTTTEGACVGAASAEKLIGWTAVPKDGAPGSDLLAVVADRRSALPPLIHAGDCVLIDRRLQKIVSGRPVLAHIPGQDPRFRRAGICHDNDCRVLVLAGADDGELDCIQLKDAGDWHRFVIGRAVRVLTPLAGK